MKIPTNFRIISTSSPWERVQWWIPLEEDPKPLHKCVSSMVVLFPSFFAAHHYQHSLPMFDLGLDSMELV